MSCAGGITVPSAGYVSSCTAPTTGTTLSGTTLTPGAPTGVTCAATYFLSAATVKYT